jgi:hypothetical protein
MLPAPATLSDAQIELWDRIATRLVVLDERAWEERLSAQTIQNWLGNFTGLTGATVALEQLHALHLLSQFMYYGSREMRVLLRSLYRELFLLPLANRIRSVSPTPSEFTDRLRGEHAATRFLGVGNPSESGVHLLYYFRQENRLSKDHFLDSAQIYSSKIDAAGGRTRIARYQDVKRYIFIDDICGSGETAERYSKDLLPDLIANQPDAELHYLALFATSSGLKRVRENTIFAERSEAVYELDPSYKFCGGQSRYFSNTPPEIHVSLLISLASSYGALIYPSDALGFGDSQLLLGFSHNTPDNTLPIIWGDPDNGSSCKWMPVFKRYPKFATI